MQTILVKCLENIMFPLQLQIHTTQLQCSPITKNFVKEFNRKWHISTTPHKTKNNRTLFKLIQQFIWSPSVALWQKFKIRNLLKVEFSSHILPVSVINWTCVSRLLILIFLRKATQGDHIRLLYQFEQCTFFGVKGHCGSVPHSVKGSFVCSD